MSTYFISDIHGEYDLFIKLLKKINFSEEDTLYILGDIIDKGKDSTKLVHFIYQQKNIIAIMGNHEYSFSQYVKGLINSINSENKDFILSKINDYFPQKSELLNENEIFYLLDLPYYIETQEFICVHAGLEISDNKILPLSKQNFNYMLFDRHFKTSKFESIGKPILFGHTPCSYDNNTGKFIKTLKINCSPFKFSSYSKIRLDTGVSYTKMLGVLRKEDMKEFYVNN